MVTELLSPNLSSRVLGVGDLERFSPREDVALDFKAMIDFMDPSEIVVIEDDENILSLCGAALYQWGYEVFVIPSVYLREEQHFGFFKLCKKMVDATVEVAGEAYAHCHKNSHEKWLLALGFMLDQEMRVGELEYYRFKKVK